jgi:hypothetical protein
MIFVVAHEPEPGDRSAAAVSLRFAAECARQQGLAVVRLPFPFPEVEDVLPHRLPGNLAVYSGPVPQSFEHYRSLESTLAARGVVLLNSSAASEQATRIENWGSLLEDLSARTVILRSPADLGEAADLGFPLFIKGGVKSAKEQGLAACLAVDSTALRVRAHAAWGREQILVAREFLPLRQSGVTRMDFPLAREYRATFLDADALGFQYYWGGADPEGALTAFERESALTLAKTAASRLEARALVVDVAEREDGSWCVVEVGDAGHTGLAHVPPHRYWTTLAQRLG